MDDYKDIPQRPTTDNQDAWRAYWKQQGDSWRSESEIEEQRQVQLMACLKNPVYVEKGVYPLKGIEPKLSRGDIEWLLHMHENEQGPVYWSEASQRGRKGLDLRGADLRGLDLQGLPLANMQGQLDVGARFHMLMDRTVAPRGGKLEGVELLANLMGTSLRAIFEPDEAAAVHLEGAKLHSAHLEGADLRGAHLEGAQLYDAYLEGASLHSAYLEGAQLVRTHLERTWLEGTHLEGADLTDAHLEEAGLIPAHLEGAHLEGANLEGANLGGKRVSDEQLERVRKWCGPVSQFAQTLSPADLRLAFFDTGSNLSGITLIDGNHVGVKLADVHWGDANLTVIDWADVRLLGDEQEALQHKWPNRFRVSMEVSREIRRAMESSHIDEKFEQRKTGEVVRYFLPMLLRFQQDQVNRRISNAIPPYRDAYKEAVRANRQLAIVLQARGLDENAAHFSFRAQLLQRAVLKSERKYGQRLFSLFLDLLTGYGYRMGRILIAYGVVITLFALVSGTSSKYNGFPWASIQ